MAGLSMGSIQTSITAFEYPEYFSYIGLFSGFFVFYSGDKIWTWSREERPLINI